MRNRGALQIQLNQILLGLLDRLADGHGNFARLAHAEAGVALLIAHHDQRRKAEILAALDDFGDAVDRDDLILQVRLALTSMAAGPPSVSLRICFDIGLELQPRFPGRFRQRLARGRDTDIRRDRTPPSRLPAARARSAITLPTTFAAAMLPPPFISLRDSLSSELAETSVRPLRSSMTCA